MPHIKDDLFGKSVIYIYEHDSQGAMAFIINKALPISIGDILRQLKMNIASPQANEFFLLQGGPVSKEQLYILCFDLENADQPLLLEQPQHLLEDFSNGQRLNNTLGFLGYAGWGAGQIEQELINNDWLICPFDLDILTKASSNQRWEYCLRKIGVDPFYLSDKIGHA